MSKGLVLMLSKMKVGTKLLVLVLPLMLVLLVLGGIGVRDRLSRSADAEQAQQGTALIAAASQLSEEIDQEMIQLIAGTAGDRVGLEEQFVATNEASTSFFAVADALDLDAINPRLTERVEVARTIAAGNNMRAELRTVTDGDEIVEAYSEVSQALVDVIEETRNAISDTDTFYDLTDLGHLLNAGQADTAANGLALTNLIEGSDVGFRAQNARTFIAEIDSELDQFRQSSPERAPALDEAIAHPAWQETVIMRGTALGLLSGDDAVDGVTVERLSDHATDQRTQYSALAQDIFPDIEAAATNDKQSADRQTMIFALGTLLSVLLAGILAWLVSRSIVGPLRRLTEAADDLATVRLPALVDRLKDPNSAKRSVALPPIEVHSVDEVGQLATAFNSMQSVTTEVAESQSTVLRKGISGIFVNLARRNQSLLDRQIEFIDELESNEEDADQLQNLFRLDHLATRMRRNAESLLVLAGEEPNRRRGRVVPIADVVRVAVGEVEEYSRVKIVSLDEAEVGSNVAVDVAHLLSELMENAASFSPPDTMVEVTGRTGRNDAFELTVVDQGIGMTKEQIAEANKLLAEPPPLGLELSRSLGFTVVARLAERWNIDVVMSSPGDTGVVAKVLLPKTALDGLAAVDLKRDAAAKAKPVEAKAKAKALPAEPKAKALPAETKPAEKKTAAKAGAAVGAAAAAGAVADKATSKADASESAAPAKSKKLAKRSKAKKGDDADKAAKEAELAEIKAKAAAEKAEADKTAQAEKAEADKAAKAEADKAEADKAAAEKAEADKAAQAEKAEADKAEADKAEAAKADADKADGDKADDASKADDAPASTASGLVKREKKARTEKSLDDVGADRAITSSKKSPEEIRSTLQNYHSGLKRGHQAGPDGDGEPTRLADAVPEGDAFEEGLAGLVDKSDDDSGDKPAELTGAGLIKRSRKKKAKKEPESNEAPLTASTKSPEEKRNTLNKYKGGLKRGRVTEEAEGSSESSDRS